MFDVADDLAELRSLLVSEGKVHLQDLLRFVESGVQVVPAARSGLKAAFLASPRVACNCSRVVYPDEERAREIFKDAW